jgi:uncharacterized protein
VLNTSNAIRSLFLSGPAGRLEALLNEGHSDAQYAAVVCHPHPVYGGTMHNKVVFHTMKAINAFGIPVLRFNFRGAGLSDGEHDDGRGERDDVLTAIDWLDREFGLPIVFAGFSFGAATGLNACCADQRIAALVSIGTPVRVQERVYRYEFLESCDKPKLFVSGSEDEYGPPPALAELAARAAEPKKLVIVKNANHFFVGHLDELRQVVASWLRDALHLPTVMAEAPEPPAS